MGSLTPALSKERELQASRIIISRRGRKEREDSSADEWRTPTTHLLLRSNEPMKFAKAPRCLYDETHAQRAYFAAFVQFAKQEDVNLHMKNLASFASLREIKASTPDGPAQAQRVRKRV